MKFTFLGQNCFLFAYKGKNILVDPFYNFSREKSGFDISAQAIHYILLTHAHADHVADVEEVLTHHPEAMVTGTPEVCGYYKGATNAYDFNIGGTVTIDDLRIAMVTAQHTSSFDNGANGGVPVGYIFRLPGGKNLYLSGDTGVMTDMALFPKLYGKIGLSILPVGGRYTMDPEAAAFAAGELLNCAKVIGCHFDTFPIISIDHQEAQKQFAARNIELVLPELGQEFEY